jgi:Flp pilus assembly protein TadB
MLFAFFASLFGFAFAYRIAHHFIDHHLFHKREMTKIGTAYFACVIVASSAIPHSRFAVWLIVFAPLVFIFVFLEILVSGRSRAFRRNFVNVLSLVILKMKSGHSFRESFAQAIDESGEELQSILSEIASVVAFSQQENGHRFDPFITEMVEELTLIDRQPHAAVKRLDTLRNRLKVENEFRRRSGQVLSRIRAQSLVMTVLFVAILVFMSVKFGFHRNASVIGVSATLFACGSAWMWLGGRNLKWKV